MICEPYFERYGGRFWAVYDGDDSLVAVTVYKKGAAEVVRRLKLAIETLTQTRSNERS